MPETFNVGVVPQTFEQRKEAALHTLASLAKWCHCNHEPDEIEGRNVNAGSVWSFNDEVEKAVNKGWVPEFEANTFGDYDTYGWQIFCESLASVATLGEEEVRDRRDEAQRKLDEGVGKPSATDGSKGQWRASKLSEIRTYNWLLGETDG